MTNTLLGHYTKPLPAAWGADMRILACLMVLVMIPACGDICHAMLFAQRNPGVGAVDFWEAAKWVLFMIAWWAVAVYLWRWKPKQR